jgi:hypothetical protein
MKDRFHDTVEKNNTAHQFLGLQHQAATSDKRLLINNSSNLFLIDQNFFPRLISSPSVAMFVTS